MAKARKVKGRKAPVKKSLTKPPKGKVPLRVPVHTVVKFVRMLHDKQHVDHFLETAKKSKAWVELHPSALRLVRKYVADKSLRGHMVSDVIDPIPGQDPSECPCVRE